MKRYKQYMPESTSIKKKKMQKTMTVISAQPLVCFNEFHASIPW